MLVRRFKMMQWIKCKKGWKATKKKIIGLFKSGEDK